jgi:tRNA A-37 threonylcarbamoyl transferase component Bud32
MPSYVHLLRCVGNAVVKNGARALARLVPFGEVLYEIAVGAYDEYRKDHGEGDLRDALQGVAQASPLEIHQAAEQAAANEPVEVRPALVSYLDQLPAAVHQSLRRPSDPGGTTVPGGRSLGKPEDLLPFLPAGLPRFKPGDRPLAADWELVEMLGKGGFGEVWKARHLTRTTQKPVALKFCLDPVAAQSLRNEANLHDILARVQQQGGAKGIVPLLETYLRADPPCLMYELIEGGDLAGFIQEMHEAGRLTPGIAAMIVHRLATTVAFAHQLTPPLVHRDLKPSNVLVRREEGHKIRFVVADFGIGGLAAGQSIQEQAGKASVRSQTLPTAVRGAYTPLYASPQQVQGDRADPRDDVHALGVIWYQLVTGDLKLMSIPPDWRDEVEERGLPPEQMQLIASCIAARLEKRLGSAAELSERLDALRGVRKTLWVLPGGAVLGGRNRGGAAPAVACRRLAGVVEAVRTVGAGNRASSTEQRGTA